MSRDEIERYGYRTLAEALGAFTGMFSLYDRNYDYIGSRGLVDLNDINTRFLIMLDGKRINDAAANYGPTGRQFPLDLADVERIEYIRGPGSTLFGTNAFYGIINVISRTALSGLEIRANAGTLGTYQAGLAAGGVGKGINWTMAARSFRSAGDKALYFPDFDSPDNNNGIAENLDRTSSENVVLRASSGDWRMGASYGHKTKDVPTAAYETDFNRLTQTKESNAILSVDYEHSFDDLSRVLVTNSLNWYRYTGDYPYGETLSNDYIEGGWYTTEAQLLRYFGSGHKLQVGGEFRYNGLLRTGVYDVPFAGGQTDTIFSASERNTVVGAFLQAEWRLGNRGTLYTGGRYDYYQQFGGSFNPRSVFVWSLDSRTTSKLSYSRAFRAPTITELRYEDGGVSQRAPESLDPERIESFELGLERRLSARSTFTVNAYHMDAEQLITLIEDPADNLLVFSNAGNRTATGLEAELQARGLRGWEFRMGLGLQSTNERGESADVSIANSPSVVARFGGSAPIGTRLRLALDLRHLGERPTLQGAQVPASTISALTALYRIPGIKDALLTASVYDLFNVRRLDAAGVQHNFDTLRQDGRVLRAGLVVRF